MLGMLAASLLVGAREQRCHAVLLVDQAGWHLSARILVPAHITIFALPPKCPELNPVENVWQFMRDNWLSNRVFKSYDDLVELLPGLEQLGRSALAYHVHRTPPMGSQVLINEIWYKRSQKRKAG